MNMEIYNWKWMVLDVVGCMNNADLNKIVNGNIVLDVFISVSLSEITTCASNLKIPYSYIPIDLWSIQLESILHDA